VGQLVLVGGLQQLLLVADCRSALLRGCHACKVLKLSVCLYCCCEGLVELDLLLLNPRWS
jgi:hypothetical protein